VDRLSEGLEELRKTEAMLGRIARKRTRKSRAGSSSSSGGGRGQAERFLAPIMGANGGKIVV